MVIYIGFGYLTDTVILTVDALTRKVCLEIWLTLLEI